jgi:hypothetical protein
MEEPVVFEVCREGRVEPLRGINPFGRRNLDLIPGSLELRIVGNGNLDCLPQI